MLNTVLAEVREGRVVLLEPLELPEGARLLVTVLSEEDQGFWEAASQTSLDQVWDNSEDDVYGKLLEG